MHFDVDGTKLLFWWGGVCGLRFDIFVARVDLTDLVLVRHDHIGKLLFFGLSVVSPRTSSEMVLRI